MWETGSRRTSRRGFGTTPSNENDTKCDNGSWREASARDLAEGTEMANIDHGDSPASLSSSFRFPPSVTKENAKDRTSKGCHPSQICVILMVGVLMILGTTKLVQHKYRFTAVAKISDFKQHAPEPGQRQDTGEVDVSRAQDPNISAVVDEWDTFDEGMAEQEGFATELVRNEPLAIGSQRDGQLEQIGQYPAEEAAKGAIVEANLIIQGKAKRIMQHSATIAEASDGALVAAWFAGTWEAKPDAGIWLAHYQGGEWQTARELVAPGKDGPCWNPVLCKVPHTGELLLFYKVGPRPQKWKGMLMRSPDGGRTWGVAMELPRGITGPSKNKCLFTEDGTLLAPSSREAGAKGSDPAARWTSHIEYSRDGGHTWNITQNINFNGKIIQPSLVFGSDLSVRMFLRERGPETRDKYLSSNVLLAVSDRSGLNWKKPVMRTNLPCPNTGLDVIRLMDGRLLIAFNDSMQTRYAARMTLGLAISKDDGISWRRLMRLEHSEVVVKEFSYPSMILAEDGRVHVVYTWSAKKIHLEASQAMNYS